MLPLLPFAVLLTAIARDRCTDSAGKAPPEDRFEGYGGETWGKVRCHEYSVAIDGQLRRMWSYPILSKKRRETEKYVNEMKRAWRSRCKGVFIDFVTGSETDDSLFKATHAKRYGRS